MQRKNITKFFREELVPVGIISSLVFAVCLVYIFTIGSRMTKARTLYIEGYELIQDGQKEEALNKLQESQNHWFSYQTQDLLDSIK